MASAISRNRSKVAAVKRTLGDKYENLARITASKPRKAKLMRHAERFRRQAADLERLT